MDWGDFFIKAKARYSRGKHWYGYVNDAVPILLLVGVFGLGIAWFPLFICMYLISIIIIGVIDYRFRIVLRESEYATRALNPYFNRLEKDITQIKGSIKRMGALK